MKLDWETATALVYGGTILGGGGGGAMKKGLEAAELALKFGEPNMLSLSEIHPEDWVVTVSAVGAPAAKDQYVKPMDFARCISLVMDAVDYPIGGLIQNEMGGFASGNGLIQSAAFGFPLIDAPCNGRAHPLALMGSLGLHKKPDYHSIQGACGGEQKTSRRVEMLVQGHIERCSALVREASVQAGGLVAVARNPVQASWLKDTAAVGAMAASIDLGRAFLAARKAGNRTWEAVAEHLSGEVVGEGAVNTVELLTQGGFDIGSIALDTDLKLSFMNEYITVDAARDRLYTFPDLITTFDTISGEVINTADLREGMTVAVVATHGSNLVLGAGMRDRDLFERVEEILSRPVIRYIFGGE